MLACLQKMKYYASMDIIEFASMGGKARASSMSPEQRSEQARRAAFAMWEKRRAAMALADRQSVKRAGRSLAKLRMSKMTPEQRRGVARLGGKASVIARRAKAARKNRKAA